MGDCQRVLGAVPVELGYHFLNCLENFSLERCPIQVRIATRVYVVSSLHEQHVSIELVVVVMDDQLPRDGLLQVEDRVFDVGFDMAHLMTSTARECARFDVQILASKKNNDF